MDVQVGAEQKGVAMGEGDGLVVWHRGSLGSWCVCLGHFTGRRRAILWQRQVWEVERGVVSSPARLRVRAETAELLGRLARMAFEEGSRGSIATERISLSKGQ